MYYMHTHAHTHIQTQASINMQIHTWPHTLKHKHNHTHTHTLRRAMVSNGALCPSLIQPMKVVGIKAHTENDRGQVLLDLYIRSASSPPTSGSPLAVCFHNICSFDCLIVSHLFILSYVGDVEINVEVKRYFCKAGVKGIQVCLRSTTQKKKKIGNPRPCLFWCRLYWPGLHFGCLPQLHGMMRVILEPLIGDVPIVGAVTMFFISRPVRPVSFSPHLF